jgi:hypothetical protein
MFCYLGAFCSNQDHLPRRVSAQLRARFFRGGDGVAVMHRAELLRLRESHRRPFLARVHRIIYGPRRRAQLMVVLQMLHGILLHVSNQA